MGNDKEPTRASSTDSQRSTKKDTKPQPGNRRKKVRRSCLTCQRSHQTCEDARPCEPCIRRGIPDACIDGIRKKPKYLHDIPREAIMARPAFHYHNQPAAHTPRNSFSAGQNNAPYIGHQDRYWSRRASTIPVQGSPMSNMQAEREVGFIPRDRAASHRRNGNVDPPLFDPSDPALFNLDPAGLDPRKDALLGLDMSRNVRHESMHVSPKHAEASGLENADSSQLDTAMIDDPLLETLSNDLLSQACNIGADGQFENGLLSDSGSNYAFTVGSGWSSTFLGSGFDDDHLERGTDGLEI